MTIDDPAELKVIEKWREMLEKKQLRHPVGLSRSFSVPNPLDSEEQIDISLSLKVRQTVQPVSSGQLRVDSAAASHASGGKS